MKSFSITITNQKKDASTKAANRANDSTFNYIQP